MKIIECEQNDLAWQEARIGRFTASNMSMIISSLGKQSVSVDKYITNIIAEIITGKAEESFSNKHMERGKTMEEEAADYYSMIRRCDLKKVGFCVSDDDIMGCSPDRFVGDDGVLEIKTCLPKIMVEYYEKPNPEGALEQEHRSQTQATLHINSERKWIDTMLYCPDMEPIIVRSERMNGYLMDMMRYMSQARVSLTHRLTILRERGRIDERSNKYIRGI